MHSVVHARQLDVLAWQVRLVDGVERCLGQRRDGPSHACETIRTQKGVVTTARAAGTAAERAAGHQQVVDPIVSDAAFGTVSKIFHGRRQESIVRRDRDVRQGNVKDCSQSTGEARRERVSGTLGQWDDWSLLSGNDRQRCGGRERQRVSSGVGDRSHGEVANG
jgi:hypothetical protein